MYRSTMSKDGRITIPSKLRKELGLQANVKIVVTGLPDGSLILRPKNRRFLDMQGKLKSKSGAQVSVDDMSLGSA